MTTSKSVGKASEVGLLPHAKTRELWPSPIESIDTLSPRIARASFMFISANKLWQKDAIEIVTLTRSVGLPAHMGTPIWGVNVILFCTPYDIPLAVLQQDFCAVVPEVDIVVADRSTIVIQLVTAVGDFELCLNLFIPVMEFVMVGRDVL